MRTQSCDRCGQRVFYENVLCGSCNAALGFDPEALRIRAFEVSEDGTWTRTDGADGPTDRMRPCAHYADEGVCNWMVRADDPNPLCVSCRTTRVLPDLSKPDNLTYWSRLEQAKRRLFYGLRTLGLPTPSKGEDPEHGLAFQFLEQLEPTMRVMTGHDNGVITLNLAEADDSQREKMRTSMHEPVRTLLGHFRHEIGHYYWDRLVRETTWIDRYRELFGDERADYAEALKAHYANPRGDWPQQFVSAYASSHPWEDWAECWAHYMHMRDGLETAAAWGLVLEHALPGSPPVKAEALEPKSPHLERQLVERWLPISQFVNAMSRALGARDSYPFVVPQPVIEKLAFIHEVIRAAVRGDVPMNFSPAPALDEPSEPNPAPPTLEPSPA